MFDYIKGKLAYKYENSKNYYVTVEAFGVGYCLETIYRDYSAENVNNSDILLFVSLIHKEDKMSLCGFLKREDRDMFNVLTSVSGVGVKMALTLLNSFPTPDLVSIVLNGDYKSLMSAKGVGQKLAQKIIIELKGKLNEYKNLDKSATDECDSEFDNVNIKDAQSVLLSLGYELNEIKSALKKAQNLVTQPQSVEDILKVTLQILSVS